MLICLIAILLIGCDDFIPPHRIVYIREQNYERPYSGLFIKHVCVERKELHLPTQIEYAQCDAANHVCIHKKSCDCSSKSVAS